MAIKLTQTVRNHELRVLHSDAPPQYENSMIETPRLPLNARILYMAKIDKKEIEKLEKLCHNKNNLDNGDTNYS